MRYFGDQEEKSLNIFIFISLVIHAVLFVTFPQWSSLLETGSPGLEEGGVIRVIYSQSDSTIRELSPVTDPTSQISSPQVDQPRPTEEPPIEEAAAVPVEPESQDDMVPPARPRPEREPVPEEIIPEPELIEPEPEETVPEPEIVESEPTNPEQLLTSETGQEIYIDQPEEEIPVVEQDTEIEAEPEVVEEVTVAEESGPSASGEAEIGSDSDGIGREIESGIGEAEQAPPPPPPLPSASTLIAGHGRIGYPKNAEDAGVEGIVTLEVTVSTAGEIISTSVIQSSGDNRLDRQAQLTIENNWRISGFDMDYVLILDVEFSLTNGVSVYPVGERLVDE